jgi:hypothetical protein
MTDQPIDHLQDDIHLAKRNQGYWYLWRNIASEGEADEWVDWQVNLEDVGQTPEEALTELLYVARLPIYDPECLNCGQPQSVGCECLKPPVQEPDPCPIHGPHMGHALWDGWDQYDFPIGGKVTFCVSCDKARRTDEAAES